TTLFRSPIVTRQIDFVMVMRNYLNLTKPTISLLVMISALPAYVIPMTNLPSLDQTLVLLLGVFLMSSSSAVFNQILEWQTDGQMARTRGRVLPMKVVSRKQASFFGVLLGLIGFFLLYWQASQLTAIIGLIGHLYYVIFYTVILKKRTVQNIVIGGAAGAVGPLMGAATAGNVFTFEAWLLFTLIFLWTPPHFWSLSLKYQDDYAVAGIPMYPIVHGEDRTRRVIFLYCLFLIPVALLIVTTKLWIASITTVTLTGYFVYLGWELYQKKDHLSAMKLFRFSCLYALLIFVVLTLEKLFVLWQIT
ncbi:MAG: heme o synthase, partial [Proteobacteria bacterium]|nr:heme o synthase [Pseudomonadota bacterium]